MSAKCSPITAGMAVRDGTEQAVGHVEEVSVDTIRVHVQQDITLPLAAVAAVTDTRLVLPLHINLDETQPPSPTGDPYTVNVPDPSIFLS